MKVHNWKEVIKYFIDEDRDTELWDYISALRGPDDDSGSKIWKKMITCLIRGDCQTAFGIEETKEILTRWDNAKLIMSLYNSFRFTSNHWFNHSIFALQCLVTYYNEMYNIKIHDLLSELILGLNQRERNGTDGVAHIVAIVREIVKEMYEEK